MRAPHLPPITGTWATGLRLEKPVATSRQWLHSATAPQSNSSCHWPITDPSPSVSINDTFRSQRTGIITRCWLIKTLVLKSVKITTILVGIPEILFSQIIWKQRECSVLFRAGEGAFLRWSCILHNHYTFLVLENIKKTVGYADGELWELPQAGAEKKKVKPVADKTNDARVGRQESWRGAKEGMAGGVGEVPSRTK